jgi:hypothetical protein
MDNLIVASIVLYKNDRIQLLNAINSFLNTSFNVRLILVDNSPTDDLRNIIFDKRCEYFHNPNNPGFGSSHNFAIKNYVNYSKYHLILNPDIFYSSGVIEELLTFMNKNNDVGLVMPKVLYPNGDIQYLCKLLPTPYDWIGRRFNPFKSLVEKRNRLFELQFTNYDKIMEVPYLSGCFMFLRTESIKKIGYFDEKIFMYGEETDLCRRLISGGFKTIFYPMVSVVHEFQKGSHKSIRLTWIGIKSAIYYFNKWGWFFDFERKKINRFILEKLK